MSKALIFREGELTKNNEGYFLDTLKSTGLEYFNCHLFTQMII